jgi:hypothetical protein
VFITQFVIIHSLNLGMELCTSKPFFTKKSPLIIALHEYFFHHISICDLLNNCVECEMLQDYCITMNMHCWWDLVLYKPLVVL